MPATTGFQFSPTDLSLLQYVYELRLATIEQIAELTGRSYKRTADRLSRLEEHDYLRSVTRRPLKQVYGLGHEGIEVLVHDGYAPSELASKRSRVAELKHLGIGHAILMGDIHTRLLVLARARSLHISRWIEGPSLSDSVKIEGSQESIPIRPDAWFTIESHKWRSHFLLEADVGTMAHTKMREKVRGYVAYFQQQKHLKKYEGMKVFRVATITRTRGRAEELAKEYRDILQPAWLAAYPVIAFWDLTLERLMPELEQVTGA